MAEYKDVFYIPGFAFSRIGEVRNRKSAKPAEPAADVVAAMEAAEAPDGPVIPEPSFGPEAAGHNLPNPWNISISTDKAEGAEKSLSLERLLAELNRRLPGATLTIPLQ